MISWEEIDLKLRKYGKIIEVVLALIMLAQFLWVWNHDCKIEDISTSPRCIEKLVLLLIPTEVTLAEIFSPFPILLLIIFAFYWKYVEPPQNRRR